MATTVTLEERSATLEAEVAQLRRQLAANQVSANGVGVEKIAGSLASVPREEMEEIQQLCREAKQTVDDPNTLC